MGVLDKFPAFCAALKINSKEYGKVPLNFWGTQKYFLQQVQKGIDEGKRFFVTLKGRQGGVSTASLALVLFWLSKYRGTLGSLIVDDGSNLIRFRSILTGYMNSLPPEFRVRKKSHNIHELELINESVLSYLVAGKRKKAEGGDLGQGKGLNLVHGTEVSSWSDEKQIDKLVDSLAKIHPNRLYLFESTANGFNLYYDMWETAKRATTQKAIFIGWWLQETYQCDRNSNEFRVYWDGKMTKEESMWVREVKLRYGFEIRPEQLAWWRLKYYEDKREDMQALYQEHPPTEEYAFQMSGYKFFSSELLTSDYKRALKEKHENMRYQFGNDFVDTRVHRCTLAISELKIWERPNPSGVYVIGADPAYGFNENSDRSTASVFRCYADRVEQVAEYSASGVGTAQFAWVLLHLAGAYKNVRVNLELTGPGSAVFNELQNVKKMQSILPGGFADELSGMVHHLWAREDTLSKSFAYHTKTNAEGKELMLNRMNDLWKSRILVLNSLELLTEMKYFARDGAVLEGRGGEHDDRVIAAALAIISYLAWAKDPLVIANQTFAVAKAADEAGKGPASDLIMNFLKQRGLIKK
jgi:hypothetical protein